MKKCHSQKSETFAAWLPSLSPLQHKHYQVASQPTQSKKDLNKECYINFTICWREIQSSSICASYDVDSIIYNPYYLIDLDENFDDVMLQ